MRKLAGGIAGAFALLVMLIMQPWSRLDCLPDECTLTMEYGWWVSYTILLAIYLVIPTLVALIIQVAVLGIRDSSQPQDQAVLAALGQTRGSASRAAARRGLVDGAAWVGGAYVLTGAVHVVISLYAGWPPFTTDTFLWWGRAVAGIVAVAGLVVAHIIDAARPRRTPVERLYEDAAAPTVSRGRRRLGVVLGALLAAAAGVLIGIALRYDVVSLASGFKQYVWVTNTASVLMVVAWVSALALGLLVLVPAARARVPGLLRRVASWTPDEGTAEVLRARASGPSRAGGRVVAVLGSIAFVLGAASQMDSAPTLSPRYAGVIVQGGQHDPVAFAEQLRGIEGVADVVIAPVREIEGAIGGTQWVLRVDAERVRELDPVLAGLLTDHPDALIQSRNVGGTSLSDVPAADLGFQPSGIVPIATCCEAFTAGPLQERADIDVTAYLIYTTDAALNEAIMNPVMAATPADLSSEGWSGGSGNFHADSGTAELVSIALFALLLGLPMAALAVGVVRARRHEDATLAALGATPRAIRRALVIESAAVGTYAMLWGGLLGAATRALMTGLDRARMSLTGLITDSYLAASLGAIGWPLIIGGVILAVAVFATTAAIVARVQQPATPVEGLRPAGVGADR